MMEKPGFFEFFEFFHVFGSMFDKIHWKIERFGCIYRPLTRAAQPKSSENSIKYRKTEFSHHLNLAKVCVYVILAR